MCSECEGVETRGGVVEEVPTSDVKDVSFSPKAEHTAINKEECT